MSKRSLISVNSSAFRRSKISPRRSKHVGRILALAASGVLAHFVLADSTWTGSTSQDWNDGTNWSTNPPTGNFLVNTTVTGIYPIISSTSTLTPVDLKIGTAGFSGRLDQTAGTLNTGTANWMFVGQGSGGIGIYNLADTSTTGGTLTGFGVGTGSLNVGGTSTTVGRLIAGDGSSSIGTVNMNTTGTLTVEQDDIGILLGNGGTSTGNFNLDGGTVQVNALSGNIGMLLGTNGGDGNFRMSGGTVSVTGGLWLGDNNAGSQGLLDISGGVFNVTASSAIGSGSNGQVFVGRNLGQGTFNVSGTAAVTISGGVNVGFSNTATAGTAGLLSISGGSFTTTGDVRVGAAQNGNGVVAAGTGVFNISGGTANIGGVLQLARANDAGDVVTGFSTISGGTLNVSGDIVVAFAGNNTLGQMNISGGTVNAGGPGERWVIVNQWDTSRGQLIVSGGTLNLSNNTDLRFSAGNSTGASVVTLSSGAITAWNGNLTGNATSSLVDLNYAGGAAANNTFNLDGGTLTINQIITNNNNGAAAFNFNGGTLKAAGASANFVDLGGASQVANVRNGGAVIDSNGFDVTLVQVLQHSAINGDNAVDGGVTKLGSGKLQLSGNNTFTGGITISAGTVQVGNNTAATLGGGNYGGAIANAGTLAFNSTSAQTLAGGYSGGGSVQLNGTGALTFSNPGAVSNTANSISAASGATLGVKVANTGTNVLTASNLSFAGPGSLVFDFNSLANPTATLINAGNVTLNGTVNITLTNATGLSSTPNNTTLALLDYDSVSGGSFNLLTTSAGHTTYALNDTGSALYLDINGLTNYWRGAASTTWDINSALGWSAPDQKYLDGDNVVFDDSATGSTSINLTANVTPTTAVFANVARDYTITGSGGITGSEGISKTGAGKLVIVNTNSFTGATNISSGATLSLGDGTSGHDGNLTGTSGVTNNGTLEFNRFGTSTASFVISGSGGVAKNGVGTQIFTGSQTYTGATAINAGTLQLGDGTSGHDGDIGATSGVTNNGVLAFNRFGTTTSGYAISGSGSVVKDGAGTQALKAANSYSGGTTVNAGVLVSDLSLSSPGAVTPFGSGTITVNSGQVELGVNGGAFSQYSYANDLVLNGGAVYALDGFHRLTGNIAVGSGGGSLGSTFSTYYETRINGFQKGLFVDGLLSGSGNLTIQDSGYASGNFWNVSVVYLTNPGTSSYSGTVTTGSTAGTANYLFLVGQTVLADATINVAGNNAAGAVLGTAKLLFGPGNGVDAGPTSYTIGALSGDGNLVLEETPKSTGAGVSGGGPAVILHVGGNNASTSYAGVMSGTGTLVKSGTGTLTLTGANSFTGGTSLQGGTLAVSGSGRLGSGNVEVGDTTTLSLAFNDAISDGATLTIDNGGTVQLTGGVETVGTLVLGGTTFSSGSFGGVGSGADNVFGDFFAPATSGNFVSVPEPSTLGLMAIGGVGLLRRRRRMK